MTHFSFALSHALSQHYWLLFCATCSFHNSVSHGHRLDPGRGSRKKKDRCSEFVVVMSAAAFAACSQVPAATEGAVLRKF